MTLPYKGWSFLAEDDGNRERASMFFYAVRGAESVMLDWSPYYTYGPDRFAKMVDMGFPTRSATGSVAPLRPQDVDYLFTMKVAA